MKTSDVIEILNTPKGYKRLQKIREKVISEIDYNIFVCELIAANLIKIRDNLSERSIYD